MFCAYNENNKIIAFHEEKRVVKSYVEKVYKFNKIILDVKKLKKKDEYLLDGLDDLYLVRYCDAYIQKGYSLFLELNNDQFIYDNQYARDVILRILETDRCIKKKEIKALEKAVDIIDKLLQDDRTYTPSLEDLSRMKTQYEPYFYNKDIYWGL